MYSLYEWLYTHYCKPMGRRAEFLRPWAAEAAGNARTLLLLGEGDQLDRLDAIDTLETVAGITAFALGLRFARGLTEEISFPED